MPIRFIYLLLFILTIMTVLSITFLTLSSLRPHQTILTTVIDLCN